jgi:UDP-3-O-[3-hydroxymyristoyl] glucosamine N-acyltransferase
MKETGPHQPSTASDNIASGKEFIVLHVTDAMRDMLGYIKNESIILKRWWNSCTQSYGGYVDANSYDKIHPTTYISPSSRIIGEVVIGEQCIIGSPTQVTPSRYNIDNLGEIPGAIIIGKKSVAGNAEVQQRTNIGPLDIVMQNGSQPTFIEDRVTVGCRTVILPDSRIMMGAKIGNCCDLGFSTLIGRNTVVEDDVFIYDQSDIDCNSHLEYGSCISMPVSTGANFRLGKRASITRIDGNDDGRFEIGCNIYVPNYAVIEAMENHRIPNNSLILDLSTYMPQHYAWHCSSAIAYIQESVDYSYKKVGSIAEEPEKTITPYAIYSYSCIDYTVTLPIMLIKDCINKSIRVAASREPMPNEDLKITITDVYKAVSKIITTQTQHNEPPCLSVWLLYHVSQAEEILRFFTKKPLGS